MVTKTFLSISNSIIGVKLQLPFLYFLTADKSYHPYSSRLQSHTIYTTITRTQCQMAVNAETILVHTINIMVFTHIDTVTIMISIAAPHKVMPPQVLIMREVVSKESIAAKNGRREVQAPLGQISRHHST